MVHAVTPCIDVMMATTCKSANSQAYLCSAPELLKTEATDLLQEVVNTCDKHIHQQNWQNSML